MKSSKSPLLHKAKISDFLLINAVVTLAALSAEDYARRSGDAAPAQSRGRAFTPSPAAVALWDSVTRNVKPGRVTAAKPVVAGFYATHQHGIGSRGVRRGMVSQRKRKARAR